MADELVTNPDFAAVEEGVPEGWTLELGNPRTKPRYGVVDRDGTRWMQFAMRESGASMGYIWQHVMLPEGTEAVRFQADVRCDGAAEPLEHSLVRIYWDDEPRVHTGWPPWIYRHFPQYAEVDGGLARLDATIPVPERANRVRFDLMARWSPGGAVSFANPSMQPVPAPQRRIVRLAAVQGHAASGSTLQDAIDWAVEQVRVAAEKAADLICLGEGINYAGIEDLEPLQACEPIPGGPMARALAAAADESDIIVCAGLYEIDGDICHNSAALWGRDGELIGVYRKVHLPSPEVEWGFTPGSSYPVFETDIGHVGMQICYDNCFSEGARALALNGAEIICLPIWGAGRADDTAWPHGARMLALNNAVAYVAAIYSQRESCVIDQHGIVLASAGGEDGVYVADVDLTPHAALNNWSEDDQITPRSYRGVWRRERMPQTYGPVLGW
ncbi:MAG: carbon-nitrogen hydrolase family protein [Armatimonadota bacterium]|nr:carbon-nitrogen hydrolase family protein [Armatimonadota bacterium]